MANETHDHEEEVLCSWCGLPLEECNATREQDYERWQEQAYEALGIEKGYDARPETLTFLSLLGPDPSRCFCIFEILSKEGLLVEVGDCWSSDPNYELFVQPYAMGRLMQLRRYYGFPSGCD
jgi:hypothetical protein